MKKEFMAESRFTDGTLNVKDNSCPFIIATEKQLFDYFFQKHPDLQRASWQELTEYFNSNGWFIRPKTW